jgi:hypothetical protein
MAKNIGKFFVQPKIRELLYNLTGNDPNKIFASKFNVNLSNPKIELLSEEELRRVIF